MRQKLAPLLFEEDDPDAAGFHRGTGASAGIARAKARGKRSDSPHSFRTLLDDLATLTLNTVQPRLPDARPFEATTRPTPLQGKAHDLFGVRP